jgi:hypothetical protein
MNASTSWPRVKWIDRQFNFDFPAGIGPEIMERLRGTPARVEERLRGISPGILTARPGDSWSIQEHVGHLVDLEALFDGRLDDYERGLPILRPADMGNRQTWEAQHNNRPVVAILEALRTTRVRFVKRLEALPFEWLERRARHPRLQREVRLVDMMYFQAEHDDYHLARVSAGLEAHDR